MCVLKTLHYVILQLAQLQPNDMNLIRPCPVRLHLVLLFGLFGSVRLASLARTHQDVTGRTSAVTPPASPETLRREPASRVRTNVFIKTA